ncbi:MAG: hypothetical protein A2Y64_01215 [Candidatus Coatesbacteria bacterium RBG_13_66_14]|uniref:Uncharacterized protein n=1 Tax=Candidatus Coatesbacteria bacterium RBG_13_66_14 TaxID=1817816 RepID=A0A1F5FGY7_9BACT|nr:MAG: hypothetical protein A2Y64_01215 [Candidatus Coatesbacteria bacterium RBG_13_66_14]
MLEPWQKRAVFRRAFLGASRLTLLVALLGAAVVFNFVLAWFWPSVGLLAVAVIGYVVWSVSDTGRPVHIARSVLREISGLSGLSHRFKSRLAVIERVFTNFWEKTDGLDEEIIGETRREALRALLALTSRLRAVGLADRVNRDARRVGKASDRAEAMVAAAVDEVERFIEMLNRTAVAAAEVLLASREEALERMTRAAEELALWQKSLAEAKIELDESGL